MVNKIFLYFIRYINYLSEELFFNFSECFSIFSFQFKIKTRFFNNNNVVKSGYKSSETVLQKLLTWPVTVYSYIYSLPIYQLFFLVNLSRLNIVLNKKCLQW